MCIHGIWYMVERGSTNKQYILFTNSDTITFCVRHIPLCVSRPCVVLCCTDPCPQCLTLVSFIRPWDAAKFAIPLKQTDTPCVKPRLKIYFHCRETLGLLHAFFVGIWASHIGTGINFISGGYYYFSVYRLILYLRSFRSRDTSEGTHQFNTLSLSMRYWCWQIY